MPTFNKKIENIHKYLNEESEKVKSLEALICAINNDNDRMRDALHKIAEWQKAYPLDIFNEPDFKLAGITLKEVGLSLDAISASNMRHVLKGIEKIVNIGLGKY